MAEEQARPWGIESPILTEVLSQIVNGRMLRPGLPVENQADRRGEDILDKGIHQKPHGDRRAGSGLAKRADVSGYSRNVFPTAEGTTAGPKADVSAPIARQPVQCPAAMVFRLNVRIASTVSGMIFSVLPDR